MSSKTAAEGIQPSRRKRWSLAGRLTALYAISAFALVMVSTSLLYWSLVGSLAEEDDQFLAERAQVIRRLLRDERAKSLELHWEVESEWRGVSAPESYVRIMDPNGNIVSETPGMRKDLPAGWFPPTFAGADDVRQGEDVRSRSGQLFRVVAFEVDRPPPVGKQIVQIAVDRSSDEAVQARSRRILILVLSAAMLLSLFAGYQIAHRGTRPVTAMAATASRIGSGTLGERLPAADMPAEIGTLAETFNGMLGRLEESFDRLSRFSADLAHELRTPLNNLRGEAEVALRKARSADDYREVLSSSLEEYERLARIIDSLLFLARAESPEMRLSKEAVDLGRELSGVKDFYEAAAHEKGVEIHVEADRPVIATADRTLLQRAIGNLVSNAIAHTPAQGRITLRAVADNGSVGVEIADNGAGIAPEHLARIFDRFYRADAARSRDSGGVGLGLAIVRSIASIHDGSVDIRSEAGCGTTARLTLPLTRKA